MEELIYTIDTARTEQDDTLVIHIQIAKREGFILVPLQIQPPLTQERLNALATAKDTSILPFLISEENAYLKKNTGRSIDRKFTSLNYVHISPKETLQAFKLFSMTGKLHYRDKALVIDLYGKTQLYYSLDNADEKQKTSAYIKSESQEFDLTTCDFVGKGPPRFIIKGVTLKVLSTDISWKDLKNSFEGTCRPIHDLMEEADEDPEAPRVVVNTPVHTPITTQPLPILTLKDRLGAFAELEMDYGQSKPIPYHGLQATSVDKSVKRLPQLEAAWEKDLLETDFIKKSVGTTNYYCPLDKVAKSIAFLLEIGWQVRDWRGNRVLLQNHMDLQSESNADHIVIKGKVHYGDFEANLSEIVGAFNRRERFAEIAPGHVALLPGSWEQSGMESLVEEAEIIGDGLCMKKNRFGSLASLFEAHPKIQLDHDLKMLTQRIDSFEGVQTKEPGSGFLGSLRPYQQEGLSWLSFLYDFGFHGILADDMGLGKTVQVIAFLSTLKIESPVLIVLPTSLIFNWKKELERFLPSMDVYIHHGSKRSNRIEDLDKPQVILTTYATVRLDFPLFSQISFSCLFLDEAQAIKNSNSQTAQSVTRLKAGFRLSITGTPIENHIMELWSHFNFLMPDLFGDEKAFASEVQAGMSDPRFHKRIRRTIRPFLLRRRKEQVAKDLPEKIEQTIWVEMGEEQRAVYESFLSGVRKRLLAKVSADGISKHRIEVLEAIMRLRQICCSPLLVSSEGMKESAESAKLDILMQDLETVIEEGRKVLVYSQFTSMLSLIGARVKEKGWKSVYLDGSTQNREKVVTEFQENPEVSLFLISLKAGGIGLNLTAADYVFLYDPWWNNAVENQAIDRAHRIGRKDTVIAKRYITAESIEEKMMKLKAAKSALSTDLLDDNAVLGTLQPDDLLFLLS
ncbi:MAG TPA: DEAD/DEAH box helicase [Parachlamydiaceae bacterium]|nr:DEAD/DEAH box helicase [Parachlamydiaceae bacterium]